MKDIIWTLILVWFIYKIVEVFQSYSKKNVGHQQSAPVESPKAPQEKDLRHAVQKHVNREGEYVDFEELK